MAQETGLNPAKERAAHLLAERVLTFTEIAEEVGVTRNTLLNWRKNPEFAAKVEELLEAFRAEALRLGIANQAYRLKAMSTRHATLTGVLAVRDWVNLPDAALLAELRSLELAMAKETGQLVDRTRTEVSFENVSDDDLVARAAGLVAGSGPQGPHGPVAGG